MMKTFAALLLSTVLSTSAFAGENLGVATSKADFQLTRSEVSSTIYEKTLLHSGDVISTQKNHVQVFSPESNVQILIGQNASLQSIDEKNFKISKGSMVISGDEFSVITEHGPLIKSNDQSTMASVHLFRDDEIALQVIEGNITVSHADGSPMANVANEQGVVLTKQNGAWSIKPDETGAPAFFPILAQIDDEGGSAVEEDEEDRRRFFLLTPLFIAGTAATAAVAGGVVVNEEIVNDDDDDKDDDDDTPNSPIFNQNTVFTSQ